MLKKGQNPHGGCEDEESVREKGGKSHDRPRVREHQYGQYLLRVIDEKKGVSGFGHIQ